MFDNDFIYLCQSHIIRLSHQVRKTKLLNMFDEYILCGVEDDRFYKYYVNRLSPAEVSDLYDEDVLPQHIIDILDEKQNRLIVQQQKEESIVKNANTKLFECQTMHIKDCFNKMLEKNIYNMESCIIYLSQCPYHQVEKSLVRLDDIFKQK
jgi:hypothetical protein